MELSNWLTSKRGRARALAVERKVSPATVSDWAAGKKRVPLAHCPYIEVFTNGEVRCEDLRPDVASYFDLVAQLVHARTGAAELAGEGT